MMAPDIKQLVPERFESATLSNGSTGGAAQEEISRRMRISQASDTVWVDWSIQVERRDILLCRT